MIFVRIRLEPSQVYEYFAENEALTDAQKHLKLAEADTSVDFVMVMEILTSMIVSVNW